MTITTAQAGQKMVETELEALTEIKALAEAFQTALSAINDRLDYPVGLNMNAKRLVNEFHSQLTYRVASEIPNLIAALTPQAPLVAPV